MKRATRSQLALIDYFASVADGESPRTHPEVRVNQASYVACIKAGWLVATDESPFHKPTEAGRAELARSDGMCRCGSPLSEHVGNKPCVFGKPSGAKNLWDLPVFGAMWADDGRDLNA